MKSSAAYLLGFFLTVIPFCNYGQVKLTGKDFILLEATYENWSPGFSQPNQPRQGGIIYRIKVVSKTKTIAGVDSMVIANQKYPIEILKGVFRNYSGPILKGDTLSIICRSDYSDQGKTTSDGIRKLTGKHAHQGYLYYRNCNKKQLFAIPLFTKNESSALNR